jgi:hypothetical protein
VYRSRAPPPRVSGPVMDISVKTTSRWLVLRIESGFLATVVVAGPEGDDVM